MDDIYGVPEPTPKIPPKMTHTWATRVKHAERFGQRCLIEAREGRYVAVKFEDGFQTLADRNHIEKIKAGM